MNIKTKGFEELKKILEGYGKKVAKPAMRKAIRSGATIVRAAVKAATPVDEGVLRRAQDYKVTNKNFNFAAYIGADVAKLKAAHDADPDRPTNIDWLVENGHVARDGHFVPPSGYMRRAASEAMPAARARMEESLRSSIESQEAK